MTMINVIHNATPEAFNLLTFPEQNPHTQQYLRNQLDQFSTTVTDVGRSFLEASRAIYEKINDSNAIRAAKAAIRMAKGFFHPNAVVELQTYEETRAAQPVMQRYIMAQPDIRALYHQQMCDGYSDTYVDYQPGIVGEDHWDYRRVMSGIVQEFVDDDGEDSWKVNMYTQGIEDEEELEFDEKVNILHTWEIIKLAIQCGEDPTDIYGGRL